VRYSPTAPALYGSCISLKNISSISHLGSSSPLHSFMASLSLSQRYLLHSPSRVILSTRSMASNTLLSIPTHVRTPHCHKRAPRLPPNHMASRYSCGSLPCIVCARLTRVGPCCASRRYSPLPSCSPGVLMASRRWCSPTQCSPLHWRTDELDAPPTTFAPCQALQR
jgi:hypothetical protein